MAVTKKPVGISLKKFQEDPYGYVAGWNKTESIRFAKYLDYKYHALDKPVVSDEAYDTLIFYIQDNWPAAKYLKKVGHKVQKKKGVIEVPLPVPMASMDKIKPGSPVLDRFIDGGRSWVISDKLDGISLEVLYDSGVPLGAYTRGDGVKGQDVSGVIPALDIPKKIPVKQEFIVRLEFIIPSAHFDANYSIHEGTGDFKTARNLGGGLLKRNEPSSGVKAYRCVCYSIVKGKGYDQPKSKQLALLKQFKFRVVANLKHKGKLDVDTLTRLHDLRKKKSRYEIDGIIVEKDVSAKPTRANPKHAKAFKINSLANSQIVKIKLIEWRVSRYGKIIPRVHIDPIILGGVEVTHFTGHNAYYIANGYRYQDRNKGLPVRPINVGASIRVIRSGDVIPYIMEVIKPSRKASTPDVPYELDERGVHALALTVEDDEKVAVKQLQHFFSTMEIEGIKEGTIKKLRAAGYDTIKKIIDASASDFLEIDGFQEKSSKTLEKNIQAGLKTATFALTAKASGVFGEKIGEKNMQKLIDHHPNIMQMAKLPKEELIARIQEVRGFKGMAVNVAIGLPKFVKFLSHHGIKIKKDVAASSDRLANLSVLFTSIRDAALQKAIKDQGGNIASSVKQANVLVIKDGASNNKIETAIESGIPVLTVDEFKRKYKL